LFGILEPFLRPVKTVGLEVEGFVIGICRKHHRSFLFPPPYWLGCSAQGFHEIAHGFTTNRHLARPKIPQWFEAFVDNSCLPARTVVVFRDAA
jgi:hypothetical protein